MYVYVVLVDCKCLSLNDSLDVYVILYVDGYNSYFMLNELFGLFSAFSSYLVIFNKVYLNNFTNSKIKTSMYSLYYVYII